MTYSCWWCMVKVYFQSNNSISTVTSFFFIYLFYKYFLTFPKFTHHQHYSPLLFHFGKNPQTYSIVCIFLIIYRSLMTEGSKQNDSNYSINEDVALCRAWIIINEDPIIENSQSSEIMWNQIIAQFFFFNLSMVPKIGR